MSKVVFAITHSEHAGAQMIWVDIAEEFRRRGHEVSLVALYPGQTPFPTLPGGLKWTHCLSAAPRSIGDAVRAIRKAAALFRSHAPDIIFTALPAANIIFPVAASLASSQSKTYTSHHSPSNTYNPAYRFLDHVVAATRRVRGVICVSNAVMASLPKWPTRFYAKCMVIHNALPAEIQALTAALHVDRTLHHRPGRQIIACGRIAEQKNYAVLVKAMQLVPEATLKIVGTGALEGSLRELAANLGLEKRVEFAGLRTREEALALIARSDVFVQPSLFEGHSLALVEASALGVPMIVSDVPSQVEAVTSKNGTRCALIRDAHDHAAWAEALNSVLDDEQLNAEMSALSLKLSIERSFSGMVSGYEALFELPVAWPSPLRDTTEPDHPRATVRARRSHEAYEFQHSGDMTAGEGAPKAVCQNDIV